MFVFFKLFFEIKIVQRLSVTLTQFPSKIRSCKIIEQYHNQNTYIDKIHHFLKISMVLPVFTCVCVCAEIQTQLHLDLCNLITYVGLCIHHHN